MASGHVNRTNRPNTWPHRPSLRREESPCQSGAVHTWHWADERGCPHSRRVLEGKRTTLGHWKSSSCGRPVFEPQVGCSPARRDIKAHASRPRTSDIRARLAPEHRPPHRTQFRLSAASGDEACARECRGAQLARPRANQAPPNTDNDISAATSPYAEQPLLYASERTASTIGALRVDGASAKFEFSRKHATEKQPRGFNVAPPYGHVRLS